MKHIVLTTALGLSLFATTAALAANGNVVSNVSLSAGPDERYPTVALLDKNAPVTIEGCIDGWSWCDVVSRCGRGWVPGSYLQAQYQDRRVFVPEYGQQLGLQVVTFDFASYWKANYRSNDLFAGRSFYSSITPQYQTIVLDRQIASQPTYGPRLDEHGSPLTGLDTNSSHALAAWAETNPAQSP